MKRTGWTSSVVVTTSTSLEDAVTRGTLSVASPYYKCWDTTKGLISSVSEAVWTLQICLIRWVGEPKTVQHDWRTVCSIFVVQSQAEIFRWPSHAVWMVSIQLSCDLPIWCEIGLCTRTLVDPYSTHHPLTYDEAMCVGWIFHVTGSENVPSIQQYGLEDRCERKWTRWKSGNTLHVPQRQWSGLHKDGRRHYSTTPLQAPSVPRVGSRIRWEPTAFPYQDQERGDFISRWHSSWFFAPSRSVSNVGMQCPETWKRTHAATLSHCGNLASWC